eukprot:TRINITY_DN4473_c0_g1_i2.p1 TRINITY_DN4473_c0_g1~~TRINITY_DN4473_c0_g1_i2.p1  ORF type:complete len:153 (-),score=23.82 TRINITY_DN4473_c0_g1_i2:50-508(-)
MEVFSPTRISIPPECTQVACGGLFSMAIVKGSIFSWGLNHCCQLGHGKTSCTTTSGAICTTHVKKQLQCTPKEIESLKGRTIRSVCCGLNFSCAICEGTPAAVFMWGDGVHYMFGNGKQTEVPVPQQCSPVTELNPKLVVCGFAHSLALAIE